MAKSYGAQLTAAEVVRTSTRTLEAIALENAVEGCVRETFGAAVGCYQGERAEGPLVDRLGLTLLADIVAANVARMPKRDVESVRSRARFVSMLRRIADALEREQRVSMRVAGTRVVVPLDAGLSVEHEVSGGDHELELQFKWRKPRSPRAAKAR